MNVRRLDATIALRLLTNERASMRYCPASILGVPRVATEAVELRGRRRLACPNRELSRDPRGPRSYLLGAASLEFSTQPLRETT